MISTATLAKGGVSDRHLTYWKGTNPFFYNSFWHTPHELQTFMITFSKPIHQKLHRISHLFRPDKIDSRANFRTSVQLLIYSGILSIILVKSIYLLIFLHIPTFSWHQSSPLSAFNLQNFHHVTNSHIITAFKTLVLHHVPVEGFPFLF